MGAVVLMDSTEVLVVGNFRDLLVLVHEEGTLMPQGGKENHFYALFAPHNTFPAHVWAQNGQILPLLGPVWQQ